jgi:hypothetical protein
VAVRGFGLVIGFIAHLQIVTISNSSTIANLHSLQFTARIVFSVCCVFTGCLVTAFNAVDPSAIVFHGSGTCWLSPTSQLDRRCYAAAYNTAGSSARGDCLRRPPCSNSSRPSADSAVSRYILRTDPQFLSCFVHNCCYADVAYTVP